MREGQGLYLHLARRPWQDKPSDYVLATGETRTVREFVDAAFAHVGVTLEWKGKGVDEKGICTKSGKVLVEIDPRYFRPTEVDLLIGNPEKAKRELGWTAKTSFADLVRDMVREDLAALEK